MFLEKDYPLNPITELTEEIYSELIIGENFQELIGKGLTGPIKFVEGEGNMPDMYYKFNPETGKWGAYTTQELLIKASLGINTKTPQPEEPESNVVEIADAESFLVALEGETADLKLTESLELTAPATVENNVKVDLNGKTITAGVFTESNGEITEGDNDSFAFWVKGGELTIDGEGTVEAKDAKYSMAVYATSGKVVINGGTFINGGKSCDLIYADGDAQIEIYGGVFKATKDDESEPGTGNEYSALNIKNSARETASIKVFGGKFYGFDPSNNMSEGEGTNFVAEGYKVVSYQETLDDAEEIEPGVLPSMTVYEVVNDID